MASSRWEGKPFPHRLDLCMHELHVAVEGCLATKLLTAHRALVCARNISAHIHNRAITREGRCKSPLARCLRQPPIVESVSCVGSLSEALDVVRRLAPGQTN